MNPQTLQIAQTLGINPTILASPQGVQVLSLLAQLATQDLMASQAQPQGMPAAGMPGPMPGAPAAMAPQAMPQQMPQMGPPPTAMSELGRRDPYSISMSPGAM